MSVKQEGRVKQVIVLMLVALPVVMCFLFVAYLKRIPTAIVPSGAIRLSRTPEETATYPYISAVRRFWYYESYKLSDSIPENIVAFYEDIGDCSELLPPTGTIETSYWRCSAKVQFMGEADLFLTIPQDDGSSDGASEFLVEVSWEPPL